MHFTRYFNKFNQHEFCFMIYDFWRRKYKFYILISLNNVKLFIYLFIVNNKDEQYFSFKYVIKLRYGCCNSCGEIYEYNFMNIYQKKAGRNIWSFFYPFICILRGYIACKQIYSEHKSVHFVKNSMLSRLHLKHIFHFSK